MTTDNKLPRITEGTDLTTNSAFAPGKVTTNEIQLIFHPFFFGREELLVPLPCRLPLADITAVITTVCGHALPVHIPNMTHHGVEKIPVMADDD